MDQPDYLQIVCQTHWLEVLHMYCGAHCLAPTGGTMGVGSGAIDGGGIGAIVGGPRGGRNVD
jgi:hypothetical protein